MKNLIYLNLILFAFIITSCNQDKPIDEAKEDSSFVVNDRVSSNETPEKQFYVEPLDFNYKQIDLAIFQFVKYERDTFGFVSLSDIINNLSENPDSLSVPEEYLGDRKKEDAKHTKLMGKYRQRFLSETKIKETDKVFIYNYFTESLLIFNVEELDVMAVLSIYSYSDSPISQGDYEIGFGIGEKTIKGFLKEYENALVYIGKENPFIVGGIKPIIWKKTNPESFPENINGSKDLSKLPKFTTENTYLFEMDGLKYFVQDMVFKEDYIWRHLMILKSNNNELVFEDIFYESESSSLAPLNGIREDSGINQWTGLLFKNRPPVVFGFEYISFGCENINFLNNSHEFVNLLCDNRH